MCKENANHHLYNIDNYENNIYIDYENDSDIPYHFSSPGVFISQLYNKEFATVQSVDQIVLSFALNDDKYDTIHKYLEMNSDSEPITVNPTFGRNNYKKTYSIKSLESYMLVKIGTKDNPNEGIVVFNPNKTMQGVDEIGTINEDELQVVNNIAACSDIFHVLSYDMTIDIYGICREKIFFGLNKADSYFVKDTEYLRDIGQNYRFKIYQKSANVVRLEMTVFQNKKNVDELVKDYVDNFPSIFFSRFNPNFDLSNQSSTFVERHIQAIRSGLTQNNPIKYLENEMFPLSKTQLKELNTLKNTDIEVYNNKLKEYEVTSFYTNGKKKTGPNTYKHHHEQRDKIIDIWKGKCIEEFMPDTVMIDSFRKMLSAWHDYFSSTINIKKSTINTSEIQDDYLYYSVNNAITEDEYELLLNDLFEYGCVQIDNYILDWTEVVHASQSYLSDSAFIKLTNLRKLLTDDDIEYLQNKERVDIPLSDDTLLEAIDCLKNINQPDIKHLLSLNNIKTIGEARNALNKYYLGDYNPDNITCWLGVLIYFIKKCTTISENIIINSFSNITPPVK